MSTDSPGNNASGTRFGPQLSSETAATCTSSSTKLDWLSTVKVESLSSVVTMQPPSATARSAEIERVRRDVMVNHDRDLRAAHAKSAEAALEHVDHDVRLGDAPRAGRARPRAGLGGSTTAAI